MQNGFNRKQTTATGNDYRTIINARTLVEECLLTF